MESYVTVDPLNSVQDASLTITPETIDQLRAFAAAERFTDLPGVDTSEEQARLSAALNSLLRTLIEGLPQHPSKLWVMAQFQPVMDSLYGEDTEGKEAFGAHLGQIMDILGIKSSDGLLGFYLY
jgi:hypothetical protein